MNREWFQLDMELPSGSSPPFARVPGAPGTLEMENPFEKKSDEEILQAEYLKLKQEQQYYEITAIAQKKAIEDLTVKFEELKILKENPPKQTAKRRNLYATIQKHKADIEAFHLLNYESQRAVKILNDSCNRLDRDFKKYRERTKELEGDFEQLKNQFYEEVTQEQDELEEKDNMIEGLVDSNEMLAQKIKDKETFIEKLQEKLTTLS
ncbi:hypothetical protein GCK72_011719 [Caenorhabditis remanei]|uniref:Uncharacterized protein n=1 Tax=Caenorhabditis remanei TaxID=31234 RepID=A0A6A5HAJ1_CAERE|nr:hypothetical protein GCK72_011719 [Caenorhabditis remanei]KAF1763453.1 hypothetical protein GCK72_011719 [Caenorhabditis remanei]